MNLELFAASILISAGFSLTVYMALARKRRRVGQDVDFTQIESRVADLITELNHVANTHVHSVEDRRDELKRVIELANNSIRRLGSLVSDLSIVEKRLRNVEPDTVIGDLADAPEQVRAGFPRPAPTRRSRQLQGGETSPVQLERSPAHSADLVREVAPSDRTSRVRARRELYAEIRALAAEGAGVEEIAGTLRIPRNEVEMVMRRGT